MARLRPDEIDVPRFMTELRRDMLADGPAEFYMLTRPSVADRASSGGNRSVNQQIVSEQSTRHATSLDEFLRYDGEEFINTAYLEILGRRPDRDGSKFYADGLFSGALGKIDILDALQRSPEGRKRGIAIPGLSKRARMRRLFRIPFVGYAARLIWLVLTLPRALRHVDAFETHVRVQLNHLDNFIKVVDRSRQDHVNRVNVDLGSKLASTSSKIERRLDQHERKFEAVDRRLDMLSEAGLGWQAEARAALTRGEERVGELIDGLDGLRRDLTNGIDVELAKYRVGLLDQERRLTILLEEARRRLPAPLDADQLSRLAAERDHMLDRLYLMIEDRFRGTRADIKSRQTLYLHDARAAAADSPSLPILDIGCGRGEWLELLHESGIAALGIDLNETMVETCKSLGLDAVEANALEFLRAAKPGSASAITGFHIIEHIPFADLVALIDEAIRVLKPGGLLIFETPNPANLLVAAHNFNIDPTHLKPLPSVLTEALLEARGFVRTEVRDLFPHPNVANRYEQPVLNEFNRLLYGPQDYGVLAWKPAG